MIRKATLDDMQYIVSLSKKESLCLGFIPKVAYEAAITGYKGGKRWSTTCNDQLFVCVENNDLVGFVMFSYGKYSKVNQICIQAERGSIQMELSSSFMNINSY